MLQKYIWPSSEGSGRLVSHFFFLGKDTLAYISSPGASSEEQGHNACLSHNAPKVNMAFQ
jgi:hypothetical protein